MAHAPAGRVQAARQRMQAEGLACMLGALQRQPGPNLQIRGGRSKLRALRKTRGMAIGFGPPSDRVVRPSTTPSVNDTREAENTVVGRATAPSRGWHPVFKGLERHRFYILAEGAIALPVTLSGGALFAS